MNCPNCNCPCCEEDRLRYDLKSHRLKVLESWNWNVGPGQARRELKEEIKSGRGGDREDWEREIKKFFSVHDANLILIQ